MRDDPIVNEVRKAREEYAKRFDYDLSEIVQDLIKKQKQPGKNVVSFPPKKVETTTANST
ncbi:MAG: hypothetical protein Tsb009_34720 [Planctomycetaceae bacterium]